MRASPAGRPRLARRQAQPLHPAHRHHDLAPARRGEDAQELGRVRQRQVQRRLRRERQEVGDAVVGQEAPLAAVRVLLGHRDQRARPQPPRALQGHDLQGGVEPAREPELVEREQRLSAARAGRAVGQLEVQPPQGRRQRARQAPLRRLHRGEVGGHQRLPACREGGPQRLDRVHGASLRSRPPGGSRPSSTAASCSAS